MVQRRQGTDDKEPVGPAASGAISWGAMLVLILLVSLVAAAIAYRLAAPFFHSR